MKFATGQKVIITGSPCQCAECQAQNGMVAIVTRPSGEDSYRITVGGNATYRREKYLRAMDMENT